MPAPPDPSPRSGPLPASTVGRWKSSGSLPPAPPAPRHFSAAPQALPPAPLVASEEPSDAASPSSRWLGDDRVPAWLVSLVLHVAFVLLLALLSTAGGDRGEGDALTVGWLAEGAVAPLLRIDATTDGATADAAQADDSAAAEPVDVAVDPERSTVEVPSPLERPATSLASDTPPRAMSSGLESLPLAMNMSGGQPGDRSGAGRSAAVAAGFATPQSEAAVDDALRWLAEHQHNDGGWSFRLEDPHGPCDGQCQNFRENPGDAPTPRTAATGLALLAFLGAGHTHQSGTYAETVRHGIYFLRSQGGSTSFGTDLQNGSMYGHGIATYALAEAYVMTGDEDLRGLVAGATTFCAAAQNPQGGWGYLPGGPADITLTAWQIMALKTAEQRDITSPTDVLPDAKEFLMTLVDEDRSRFSYNPSEAPNPSRAATPIGLVLKLYFGHLPGETAMAEGLDRLAARGPSPTWPPAKGPKQSPAKQDPANPRPAAANVYYDYYAMLALHHSRHVGRMDFARKLRDHLLATQATEGHEAGSWNFHDRYGSVGGRMYTTAMCALILQTPYRYVPLAGSDSPFEL